MFEDSKELMRNCKPSKDRKYNGKINENVQKRQTSVENSLHKKLKIEKQETHNKS